MKVSLFEMNVAFVLEDVSGFVEELVTHVARILPLPKAAVPPLHVASECGTHLVPETNWHLKIHIHRLQNSLRKFS